MKRRIEVKICGLTNVEDAKAAWNGGADYLGFVLYPKSPRYVAASDLAAILAALPTGCRAVGVFVNESRRVIESVAAECGLYAVQVHGDEPAGEFSNMPLPIWRAVWFRDRAWSPAPHAWPADRYVIDAAARGCTVAPEFLPTGSTQRRSRNSIASCWPAG